MIDSTSDSIVFFTENINLNLIDKIFYIFVIVFLICFFKDSVRLLIESISSINIGGNSFNFGNKKENSKRL